MKTIYITDKTSTQNELDESVKKINGKIPYKEREQIHLDFNNNVITEIAITEYTVRVGGVKYLKNGCDIKINFVGDFSGEIKKELNTRLNFNIK